MAAYNSGPMILDCAGHPLDLTRPVVMGILNVTPDSFSDGGLFVSKAAALAQARKLVDEGADIIDVGAESTRPGHAPVSPDEEWARLEPLLATLVREAGAPVSIDTYKAVTARRALATGVSVVNDVWGLQRDPGMAGAIAEAGAGVVVMHTRETTDPGVDIVSDMLRFFEASLDIARRAGVSTGAVSYALNGRPGVSEATRARVIEIARR